MDKELTKALAKAGAVLASGMSDLLAIRGYPPELHVAVDGSRVVVGSMHTAVRQAETGWVGHAPSSVLEPGARDTIPAVMRSLVHALNEELR